jgi:aminoglycoside phosphotransferase (APT) family kinase protein
MTGEEIERAEEVETDAELARGLVATQFPGWSDLAIRRVQAASTDNDMYRLGDRLAVRLPRRESAVAPIDKEHTWLSRLAPCLPVAIPTPVAKGAPGLGFPYPWGVVRWIEGEPLGAAPITEAGIARDLARFIAALHEIDAAGGPSPGAHNFWRGAPLRAFDPELRRRFEWLSDLDDIGAIVAAWERGLDTPARAGPATWIHGDLKSANLLLRGRRLGGVLDWSAAGVGDPAVDVAVAWTLLAGDARAAFRETLGVDEAVWARGRAWALIEGVLGLSYYRGRNDELAVAGRYVIDAVLDDHAPPTRA